LTEKPLHLATLAKMEVENRGIMQFFVKLTLLLGECETNEKSEALIRILTPLGKLYSAKKSTIFATEVMESFGGPGYMEDTEIPRILTDTLVNTIWEGTTNVLSLDVLRCISKESESLKALEECIFENVTPPLKELKKRKRSNFVFLRNMQSAYFTLRKFGSCRIHC